MAASRERRKSFYDANRSLIQSFLKTNDDDDADVVEVTPKKRQTAGRKIKLKWFEDEEYKRKESKESKKSDASINDGYDKSRLPPCHVHLVPVARTVDEVKRMFNCDLVFPKIIPESNECSSKSSSAKKPKKGEYF